MLNKPTSCYGAQRGAALVVAMLIVAMVTVMAVSLASEFLLTLRRSGNALLGEQSYAYLRGGEILAVKALIEDQQRSDDDQGQRDDMSEFWAQELPPYELDDGWLLGRVSDLQGRFNLNSLANRANTEQQGLVYTAEQRQFIRLLQTFTEPQLSQDQAKTITQSVMDWLDADTDANYFGAEDDHYFDTAPSYRAGNRLFSSISELRAVANVDQLIYEALAPHVMVWGGADLKLNIHTASENVLRSLGAKEDLSPLNEPDLESLLSSREDSGFADLESFKELPVFADRDMTEQWASLVETTDYFLFTAEAEVAERRVRLYSVLHRDNSQVTALARSYIQPW